MSIETTNLQFLKVIQGHNSGYWMETKFETDTHVPSQLKVILHCLSLRGIKQSKTDTCNTIYFIKTMQIYHTRGRIQDLWLGGGGVSRRGVWGPLKIPSGSKAEPW